MDTDAGTSPAGRATAGTSGQHHQDQGLTPRRVLLPPAVQAVNEARLSPARVAAQIATGDRPSIKIGGTGRVPVNQPQPWVEKQLQDSRVEDWR